MIASGGASAGGRAAHRGHAKSSSRGAALPRRLIVARAEDEPGAGDGPSTSGSPGGSAPERAPPPKLDLSDPAGAIVYGGRLPSRRRVSAGVLTALGVALGGNLGGVTSRLLALDGGRLAARLQLDVLVPVGGFKRCYDAGSGFEFRYPAEWLGDQTLLRRQVALDEARRSLDPPALRAAQARARQVAMPVAAFGPAGSTGELNVSVICAPIYEGFALSSLGAPADAAQRFLDQTAAPPGSDRTARLVSASQRRAAGVDYYSFEFEIESPRFRRHNVCVLASRANVLYTLTAQCPEALWPREGARLRATADSFALLVPAGREEFPASL